METENKNKGLGKNRGGDVPSLAYQMILSDFVTLLREIKQALKSAVILRIRSLQWRLRLLKLCNSFHAKDHRPQLPKKASKQSFLKLELLLCRPSKLSHLVE